MEDLAIFKLDSGGQRYHSTLLLESLNGSTEICNLFQNLIIRFRLLLALQNIVFLHRCDC